MRPQQLRLGIVDDHPVYRAGLAAVLQQSSRAIRVRWTARGIEDAVELQETEPVDGMLVDLHLDGGQSGVDGVGAILARHPGVRLIVLSGLASDLDIAEVKAAGAAGFVHKSAPVDEMVATILDLPAQRPAGWDRGRPQKSVTP